jgi:hypothetical protein
MRKWFMKSFLFWGGSPGRSEPCPPTLASQILYAGPRSKALEPRHPSPSLHRRRLLLEMNSKASLFSTVKRMTTARHAVLMYLAFRGGTMNGSHEAALRRERIFAFLSEHEALFAEQGVVISSWRWHKGRRHGPYFRLAFRESGVQRALYLGGEVRLAEEVRTILLAMQAPLRRERALARILRKVRERLRESRRVFAATVALSGLYLKGTEVRGWQSPMRTPREIPPPTAPANPNAGATRPEYLGNRP